MCRTIVGVSANLCPVDQAGKNIHSSVSCKFAESIKLVGGLPMVIPVGDKSLVKDYIETIDKLILSGGQNVHPQFYGEEKAIDSDDYNLARDEFELALLKEAIRQGKPVLAICRGLQLVNVRSISRLTITGRGSHLALRTPFAQRKAALWSVCLVRPARSILSIAKASRTWRPISEQPPLTQGIIPSKRLRLWTAAVSSAFSGIQSF